MSWLAELSNNDGLMWIIGILAVVLFTFPVFLIIRKGLSSEPQALPVELLVDHAAGGSASESASELAGPESLPPAEVAINSANKTATERATAGSNAAATAAAATPVSIASTTSPVSIAAATSPEKPAKSSPPPVAVTGSAKAQTVNESSQASETEASTTVPAATQTATRTTNPSAATAMAVPANIGKALEKTRGSIFGRIKSLFVQKEELTDEERESLEEILYTSDLGPKTVERLLSSIDEGVRAQKAALRDAANGKGRVANRGQSTSGRTASGQITGGQADSGQSSSGFDAVRLALKNEMLHIFAQVPGAESWSALLTEKKPAVLLVVGVNGAGKTTTIGKISRALAEQGKKVLVAAGDTFRAAAGSQLQVWTERAQVEIFSPEGVTDPSAVAFDACAMAQARGFDIVIIDTAGRLHTQKNLMEELKKMKRVIAKQIPEAPHQTWLVLDANSGQNALAQAREFHASIGVTGVVLTKLDGSAKGGVALGLVCEMGLPIHLIGLGEGIEDLRPFSAPEFVDSII